MAPRKIHTRAYPDPDPLEIVDNPERILRKSPKIQLSTVFRSPLRANSVPEILSALQKSQTDFLNPFRTRSFGDLDQLYPEPSLSFLEASEPLGETIFWHTGSSAVKRVSSDGSIAGEKPTSHQKIKH